MSQRPEPTQPEEPTRPSQRSSDDRWEWWTRAAMGLAALAAIVWGYIIVGGGRWSVAAHVFVIPVLGGLTLPIAFWGIIKTVFNPPLVQVRRAAGFGILITTAVFCTVPMFPAPVSTEGWTSEHTFRLPFQGTWYTTAGGPDLERNYHATTAAYRWGYDFTVREDGKRFTGEGDDLEDYYCWGETLLAPVAGTVIRLEGSLKDMAPREFDETSALGNHIVIEVGPNEYLFMAHLKKESLKVDVGQRVEAGTPVAECGNSGRAVQPHVHVHLQNRANFPLAESLPLRFSDYRADGAVVEKGMPLGAGEGGSPEGQRVTPVDR